MAVEGVYKYLKSTNRPYSANDIVQNMHKEFGKTAVQKALDDLVAQQQIFEKAYGKQKIYCVKQPEDDNAGQDNDLSLLESETEKVTQNYKKVEQETKEAEVNLRDLLASPTITEAQDQLVHLEKKVEALQAKLVKLSENTVLVSPSDRLRVKTEHDKLLKEYRKRKRLCVDIVNAIMEEYPKTKKVLMEEVGIETDEDVKMPIIKTDF